MSRRGPRALALLALAGLLVAGCGSERSANEKNFRAAIDTHLGTEPKCIGEPGITFPMPLPTGRPPEARSPAYAAILQRLDALVRLGLLSSRVERGGVAGEETVYDLTPAGRAVHRQVRKGRWDPLRPVAAFCYGTAAVESIVRFTEPAEGLGQVTSEVTYTYRLRDVAPWAEDPELRRTYPYLEQELATREGSPREARLTLVLADDGWRVVTMP